jgi:hypothetical protein
MFRGQVRDVLHLRGYTVLRKPTPVVLRDHLGSAIRRI